MLSIGKGLFASGATQRGEVVLSMRKARLLRMSPRRWRRTRGKRPRDAAVLRRGEVVTDWSRRGKKPVWYWYFLNHKRRPNLEMRWRGGTICWVSVRRISTGTELGFDYGESSAGLS
jgi:hypothetical protein